MKKMFWQRGIALGTAATMAVGLTACGDTGQNAQGNAGDGAGQSSTAEKPNVVYIVLDDVGFGDLGCYGSSISTPNMDMLAQTGIQYTNYVTSPMSSPSRASMLTGFESNFVGMGTTSDINLGDLVPNLMGNVQPECGFITHSLQENDYNTMAVGKWHLASYDHFTTDGDRSYWPSGRGFDMNYNYVGSQTNQFSPGGMFEGDEYVVPDTSDPDYHLTHDILNTTLEYIDDCPDEEPFFAYVALGAMHGPFNVAQEYIDKYDGVFDEGWDVEREKIFARQKELGIFPESAEMPHGSPKVPAWDTLSEDQKTIARKNMEVYAGFLEYTDQELGWFFDELKTRDEFDNTMFVLVSDNGANSNGGLNGTITAHDNENLFVRSTDEMMEHLDEFGSAQYGVQYNTGWAMVSDTPFQHFKTNAHYGGIRVPCIVHWTDGITEPGRLNNDLVAVSDIAPTVLDITGTERLKEINGVQQLDMQGISFADTFTSTGPRENPRTSYALMMFMDRCYTNNGYTIVTNPKTGEWELYDAVNDPTQMYNLAAEMPEKLDEMLKEYEQVTVDVLDSQNLVMDLAHGVDMQTIMERYGDTAKGLLDMVQNGTAPATEELQEYAIMLQAMQFVPEETGYAGSGLRWYQYPESALRAKEFTYENEDFLFALSAAPTTAVSHTVTTVIDGENPEGVIFAYGGIDGGYGLYVQDGKLTYVNNYCGDYQKIVSSSPLAAGKNEIAIEYQKNDYKSGHVTLMLNGAEVGSGDVKHLPMFPSYDYLSVGFDAGSQVSDAYQDEFRFNGTIENVKFQIGDDQFINN